MKSANAVCVISAFLQIFFTSLSFLRLQGRQWPAMRPYLLELDSIQTA
jgi:hypothetical protein